MKIIEDSARRFIEWTKLKIRLHHEDDELLEKLYFSKREIWWTHLGQNIGFEENGKNVVFDRPVIIFRKFNQHLLWVIPTSTKIKPENRYYHTFEQKDEKFSAIISQMRPISSKRLIRKIGKMEKDEFEKLEEAVFGLIKNDSRINK
jgi:hypothetical protein